jgi:phosphate transport system permease protein
MPAWRRSKDRLATFTISAGGACVLLAILLIFFYLVYEVLPLFGNAKVERSHSFAMASAEYEYLAIEEQGEMGLAIDHASLATFFNTTTGDIHQRVQLAPAQRVDGDLVEIVEQSPESRLIGLGYANGGVQLLKHDYRLTYPNDVRVINPRIEYPYGSEAHQVLPQAGELHKLALRDTENALVFAAAGADGSVHVLRYSKEEHFLTGEIELLEERSQLNQSFPNLQAIYIDADQRWLYLLDSRGAYGLADLTEIDESGQFSLLDEGSLFEAPASRLSASTQLLGGISLLAASDQGELAQFFVARQEQGFELARVREFASDDSTIVGLYPEQRRKGFLAVDAKGGLQIFHSTSGRRVLDHELGQAEIRLAALSPRADRLLVGLSGGGVEAWSVDNKHPDISWSALWDEVWYESYNEPEYVWQSSASNNDFEPKYSFSPLAFGTLKAAFYAMLVAAPLAICGAIFTAYFMAPALRRKIKPLIELMEALPTVILGFLAGLWLAPFVEDNLAGVFSVLVLMPVGVVLFAFLWSRMPLIYRSRIPEGWEAAILIPVVALIGYSCFAANDLLELWFFNGDMRTWITSDLGISFDQRNAMVVGVAMGLAVIPTIFSIAEDAIFAVPRHLSYGSLALGATPWQTLVGVVLPTASPGIFSGLMIGLGRAVGETMIVLMATGNTPIMDANIFEGMRTLAANIAVEVPEAEVNSTHYRVLFLAAFVLFMFTFLVNTIAELIRQRLRIKYGSL